MWPPVEQTEILTEGARGLLRVRNAVKQRFSFDLIIPIRLDG